MGKEDLGFQAVGCANHYFTSLAVGGAVTLPCSLLVNGLEKAKF